MRFFAKSSSSSLSRAQPSYVRYGAGTKTENQYGGKYENEFNELYSGNTVALDGLVGIRRHPRGRPCGIVNRAMYISPPSRLL